MLNRRALAIVNLLLFTVMFTILSAVILMILSSHVKAMEHHIRGVKAFYATEAGVVVALDAMRRSVAVPGSVAVPWSHSLAGGVLNTKPVTQAVSGVGVGISGTTMVNSTCNYTFNW